MNRCSTIGGVGACLAAALTIMGCESDAIRVAPHHLRADVQSSSAAIAFTSSRDGNAEIYVMNPDGSGAARLTNNAAADIEPAWSPDGSRIAFVSNRDGPYDIYVMNADGTGVTRLTTNAAPLTGPERPAWCGNRIAFVSDLASGFPNIYVMNADGTGVTRLTMDNAAIHDSPAWSPDCGKIAFTKDPSGRTKIFVMNADGSGLTQLTFSSSATNDQDLAPAWSPDGTKITFATDRATPRGGNAELHEIYVMNADGTGMTRVTYGLAGGAYETSEHPTWSPDGSRIAFTSNSSGHYEIYVINADGTGETRLTNDSSVDQDPAWLVIATTPTNVSTTARASLLTPRAQLAAGAVNGSLYAIGGETDAAATRSVEVYDPVRDVWTTKASLPFDRTGLAAGVVNGILYVVGGVGGADGVILASLQAYDPATNSWTTKTSMPTGRYGLAAGVVNGILYAAGGVDSSGAMVATVEAYNPATDTWQTKAPMPTGRMGLAVTVVNGILYAVDGVGGGGPGGIMLGTVEAYDPATDTWTTRRSMPVERYAPAAAVVNGILYVVGGAGGDGKTIDAYDPATDTWTAVGSMLFERSWLTAGVVNGVLYAVGGYGPTGRVVGTVEAYQP